MVDALRARAEYDSAWTIANDLHAFAERDEEALPYELGDARRLVTTLDLVRRLPRAQQLELAAADALKDATVESYGESEYDACATSALTMLRTQERILGTDHPEVAESHFFLGLSLAEIGKPQDAEQHLREALRILRVTVEPVHPLLDATYNGMALFLDAQGRLREAETYYRLSLSSSRALGDSAGLAITLNNIGDIYTNLGSFGPAKESLEEALSIRKALGDSNGAAQSLLGLGVRSLYIRSYDESKGYTREALGLLESQSVRDSSMILSAVNNLASALHEEGDDEEAVPLYQRVVAIRSARSPGGSPELARSYTNLANALTSLAVFDSAETLYAAATAMFERFRGRDHIDFLWTIRNHADLDFERGEARSALARYEEAARIYENVRSRLGERTEFTVTLSPYASIAACDLQLGRGAEAWEATERALGRMLADRIIGRVGRSSSPDELAAAQQLNEAVRSAENQLVALAGAGEKEASDANPARRSAALAQLAQAQAEWSEFQGRMEKQHPSLVVPSFTLPHIQSVLAAGEALLGWVTQAEGERSACAWGYVVRKVGPVRWARVPLRSDPRSPSPPAAFCEAIVAKRDASHWGAEVYRARIAPLQDALNGVTDLVVIPSGDMLGVPVEAVGPAPDSLLGDRCVVSYSQSATLFAWLRESTTSGGHTAPFHVLAFADPPFNPSQATEMLHERTPVTPDRPPVEVAAAGDSAREALRDVFENATDAIARLPRVRNARVEVAKLQQISSPGSLLLYGADASEERLRELIRADELRRFTIVHFGTHAFVDALAPERSFLVLSQVHPAASGEVELQEDGVVTVGDILRDWKLDADLVTLSACETGLGMSVAGEGYLGFTHAILASGAHSVIVTLWSIGDRSSARLVQSFYAELSKPGTTKAQALAAAKRSLRNFVDDQGGHPFAAPRYWAGVVLFGAR